MAVDTTIQFNGHNSYKITEPLFCYPFGVQDMTHITHSFQAYATSMLASATRAKTKFFKADGSLASEVSHAFDVTAVFGKVEITVPVPATAVQAQLVFLHGGTDWWFAEPKSEEGQSATPYNVNYAGQLTYITPNGIYTGMVTANQIVVTGSIAQPDETLETRLVTINNGVINLSSTLSAKTTKITNEGVYTGEVVASQITAGYISVDRLESESITGAKLANATITNAKISDLHGSKITAGSVTADKINVTDLSVGKLINLTNPKNYLTLTDSIGGHKVILYSAVSGASSVERGSIDVTPTVLAILGTVRTGDTSSPGVQAVALAHGNAAVSAWNGSKSEMSLGNNSVGVDSTGVYKIINGGARQYL